jgi:sulfate permease, SulP family
MKTKSPPPNHEPGLLRPMIRSFGGYRLAYVPQDLLAGLTLAAIAIPEQMATARLAGLPPEIGFFAFIAGSLGFAFFGDNRFLSCGADSTIAPIFAGGLTILVAASASPTEYAALAALLALMVGVLVCAGGFFRLGWIANLLSVPVMTGFLAGIGLHIIVSQLPSVLGLPHQNGTLVENTLAILAHGGDINPLTLAIGASVFAVVTLSDRIDAKIPGALIGLGVATVAVLIFHLEGHGVEVIGTIHPHWPGLLLPYALHDMISLLPLSLIIALVVMIQTAAVTRAFPSQPETPPDVARDYVGVGAGCLLAGLIGAFPVDASPPRTEIVRQSGGCSQLAGLTAAALILVVLLIGASLLAHVPEAALGGVLLFIAFRIIRLQVMAKIYRESLGEFALVAATWAAIVFMPIEIGVAIGIGLSLLHGIWSITRAHAILLERVAGTTIWWPLGDGGETLPNVMVVAFQAPLSFLNADIFRRDMSALLDKAREPIRILVLEASAILEIDFTAAQVLSQLVRRCGEQKITFAIARLESLRAQEGLRRFGIDALIGADRLFHSVEEAIDALDAEAKPP